MAMFFAGISGNVTNLLYHPHDIGINDNSSEMYITDTRNHRIMLYRLGVDNGTIILGGQGPGTNKTQVYHPAALYFDSISNSILIANYLAHTIVRYTLGAHEWELIAGNINGVSGSNSTMLRNPHRVALDPMGNMYIADANNHRIQFFYNGQLNGITIAGITSVPHNNASTLNRPYSVILDNQLNLYVVDTFNHRIQKFLRY